jgi:hypothetical protein
MPAFKYPVRPLPDRKWGQLPIAAPPAPDNRQGRRAMASWARH